MTNDQISQDPISEGTIRHMTADILAIQSKGEIIETYAKDTRILSAYGDKAETIIKKKHPKKIFKHEIEGVTMVHALMPYPFAVQYPQAIHWLFVGLVVWVVASIVMVGIWYAITSKFMRGDIEVNKEMAEKKFDDDDQIQQLKDWENKNK
jgi:hypothetical protein